MTGVGVFASRNDRGAALAGVILAGAMIGALGVVLAFSVWARIASARVARDDAEARFVARGLLEASAGWFEFAERGGLVVPPDSGDVMRHRRSADRTLYKETTGQLFRPPDGPATADAFLGTRDAPDVLLEAGGRGEAKLAELMDALGAPAGMRLARLAFFAPPFGAREGTLASVECVVEIRRSGGQARRVVMQAELWRLPWDPLARPLVVEGDARLAGEASWRFGEAWIGGDLSSDAAAEASWPSSMPWTGPDEPLLDDHDGDGAPDDADGDGRADLQDWRDEPGAVEDPWWRARVGGAWRGTTRSSCLPALPFGPRDLPPREIAREDERSGLLVGCAPLGVDALPSAWHALAALRGRGVLRARESEERPGRFVPAWGGNALAPSELLPPRGALALLEARPLAAPLEIQLEGVRGALLVRGRDLRVGPGIARNRVARVPADPRDTAGALRAAASTDPLAPLEELGAACSGWRVGAWRPPAGTERAARECPARPLHLEGLLATDGHVEILAGLRLAGQVRAGSLELRGGAPETLIEARPEGLGLDRSRPGPPGAPRVVARGVRRAGR